MHKGFRDIYTQQVAQLLQPNARVDWHGNLALRMRALAAVRSSLRDSKRALRPDAELFLLLNFDEMVIRPVTDRDSPVPANDLDKKLASDTAAILSAAIKHAGDRKELAASHVLQGAAQVLPNLNLKSFNLWEKD
jgi:hypothetical protein